MKTQTTTSQMYCSSAAMRYAQVLYELNVPKEAIQKAREIFEEVPQLQDRKSTRLNSSHSRASRMPSSA